MSSTENSKPQKAQGNQQQKTILQKILGFLPVIVMCNTIIVAAFHGPPERLLKQSQYKLVSPLEFFFSIPFLACCSLFLFGFIFLIKHNFLKFQTTRQMIALWHLTNATWWQFACDNLGGHFGIMPNMNAMYEIVDKKHTLGPKFRAELDCVYWVELFCHIPLSWITIYFLAKKDSRYHIIELFLSGIQLMGAFAYSLPEFLSGGKNWPDDPVLFGFGVTFGLVWVIVPILLLIRAIKQNTPESIRFSPEDFIQNKKNQ